MANKKRPPVNAPADSDTNAGGATNTTETAASTNFRIARTLSAQQQIDLLARNDQGKQRKVLKTLGLLSQNPRYPGLNSHKMESQRGPGGEDVWESYVENNTPGAYRVFWFYGPDPGVITVFAITPHP